MAIEIITQEKPISFEKDDVNIKNVIHEMDTFARELIVETEESFKVVTSLYRKARDWKKIIEEKRKAAIEPDRQRIAMINDIAKELSDPLDQVIDITNQKAASYTNFLLKKKEEEERKVKEAAEMLDILDDVYIPSLDTNLRGHGAMATTKEVKKFKIVDISKVPLKYLMVDESKVKSDIKFGINTIPGIEIYEEKVTSLRAR